MSALAHVVRACLLACCLGGCASVGSGSFQTYEDCTLAQRIQVGISTKSEIEAILGTAAIVRFDSGYEVWVYKHKKGAPKLLQFVPVVGLAARMIPAHTRELALLFSPDGVVKKFRLMRTQAPATPASQG